MATLDSSTLIMTAPVETVTAGSGQPEYDKYGRPTSYTAKGQVNLITVDDLKPLVEPETP